MSKYVIDDINGFAYHIRDNVAKSFTETYTENLDEFISIQQIINLVASKSKRKDKEGKFIINENIFNDIFDDIRIWLYEVGLARLAGKNLLECAWDSDANEMIFWIADKNQTQIPAKPSEDE